MYQFLDLPVAELAAGDRFLLDSMRRWVHAHSMGASPRAAIAPALSALDIDPAFFDRAMVALDQGSRDTLEIPRPCFDRVDDVEAVLLGLWRLVAAGNDSHALATARLLVDAEAAGIMVAAMAGVTRAMAMALRTR